jgi:hypothetical protein
VGLVPAQQSSIEGRRATGPPRRYSGATDSYLQNTHNMHTTRRSFVIHSLSATGALAVSGLALAQTAAPALVKDTDANAVALGYKTDGTKTDVKKYPKYAPSQNCANCSLYQAKAGDAAGACALFAGKQVAAKAWCSAWVKKAA